MLALLGGLSGVFITVGFIPYLIDIVHRRAQPERASWFIWSILGIIAFGSQLALGARASLVLPLADTLFIIIVFVLSLKYGTGGWDGWDGLSLAAAAAALWLWYQTNQPFLALVIIVAVDSLGMLLTIRKTHKKPKSETTFMWATSSLGGLLALLAVGKFTLYLSLYPLYYTLACGIVAVSIQTRRHHKTNRK